MISTNTILTHNSKSMWGKCIKRIINFIIENLIPLMIFVSVWEFIYSLNFVPAFFLPDLFSIAYTTYSHIMNFELINNSIITLFRAFTGLVMAIIIGLLIGLLMYYNKIGRFFFEPLIIFGMSFPVITLIPAFVLWFGYGHVSRILLVTLACTFPIALSTYNGASNVKKEFIWTAMCLGTRSKLKLLRKVILPASLPFILSGTRISLHISLIVAFVFEMVAGGGGLGFLEIRAARFFLAPELFATLFTILMVGFVLDRTMQYLQKTILIWI